MQAHGNATFTQAVLNVINVVTGVGLLSVPFALRRAGWAGLGILWLMGFVMNYTGAHPPTHATVLYRSAVHAPTSVDEPCQSCQLAAEHNHVQLADTYVSAPITDTCHTCAALSALAVFYAIHMYRTETLLPS